MHVINRSKFNAQDNVNNYNFRSRVKGSELIRGGPIPFKTHEYLRIKAQQELNGGMNLDGLNANNHDFRPIDKSKWITN